MSRFFQVAFILLGLLGPVRVEADDEFSCSYGADVLPKGGAEFEQWVTNENGHAADIFSRWKLREELEYGLLDNLEAAFYVNFESTYLSSRDPSSGIVNTSSEISFDGISTEWKWLLLDPVKDTFGFLAYFEPRYSGPELELEEKLVFQKNFGNSWVTVLNLTTENEYAYTADEAALTGKLQFTGGIAYHFMPEFSLGLEVKNSRVWKDWKAEDSSAWYAGPAMHFTVNKWWGTLSVLPQVSGQPSTLIGDGRYLGDDDNSRVETKLIFGIDL